LLAFAAVNLLRPTMARDDFDAHRDPENKRPRTGAARSDARSTGWPRKGRSGYGMESIRPHLRAQLEQQKLMRPTFPPEVEDDEKKTPNGDD